MNRTNLLATGAVVALMLATGTSMAQQEHGTHPPAEKSAPSGAKQPPAVKHQSDEGRKAPAGRNERLDGRMGEAPQNHGRSETTGQAPREDRPNQLNERTSEPKRGETERSPKSERNGQTPAAGKASREDRRDRATEENRTTGQAPREDGNEQHRFEQGRRKTDREESHGSIGQGAAGTRANMNVAPEKRTRIHETIIHQRNAPRMSSVNFHISVGARVPRGVRFAALPETVVEIEPAWRGFEFFLIGDEIVVVDPASLEIVAIVDA